MNINQISERTKVQAIASIRAYKDRYNRGPSYEEPRDIRDYYGDHREREICLVEEFFENERKTKPPHLRQRSCMISCPCSRCRRGTL